MTSKHYLQVLRAGVILSLITVFFVFKNLLFPYITSKQIAFNLIIEILTVFWLVLIVKFPEYNPFRHKKNYITWGLIAYFAVILLSCFFSVDFNLSFWGDIERMLGFFHIIHFLFLYFIIITAFRSWRDWQWLFASSVAVAVAVGLYGMIIEKSFSTIGNAAYVAGYMILNFYFALLLMMKSKIGNWRWLFLIPAAILLWSMRRADISGAFVGFGASVLVALAMSAILAKSKKLKIGFFGGLAVFVIFVAVVMLNNQAGWVKNNSLLKIFSDINWNNITLQTRMISWRAAWKDLPSHPVLGTGYGNYAIVFDKHFDSKFYSYTRSETFFDRAHNNIIDIVSTTGLLGLAAYLSIFAGVLYLLVVSYQTKKADKTDVVLLSALMTGYFVQNLAVFDSLVTYIALMISLGYLSYLYFGEEELRKAKEKIRVDDWKLLLFFGAFAILVAYQYNIKVYLMLDKTIDSQIAIYQGNPKEGYDLQKQAMAYNTPLDRDSRGAFVKIFSSQMAPAILKNLSKEKGNEILNYAIELAKKNYELNPKDTINLLTLAEVFNATAIYNADSIDKFNYYSSQSVKAISDAVNSSPGRATVYFSKAQILFSRGQVEGQGGAISVMEEAIKLNPEFPDGYCNLSQIYGAIGKTAEADAQMDKCIDLKGAETFSSTNYLKKVSENYVKKKDYKRALACLNRVSVLEPENANSWIELSKIYALAGDKISAKETALQAVKVNPKLKAEAESFIAGLSE